MKNTKVTLTLSSAELSESDRSESRSAILNVKNQYARITKTEAAKATSISQREGIRKPRTAKSMAVTTKTDMITDQREKGIMKLSGEAVNLGFREIGEDIVVVPWKKEENEWREEFSKEKRESKLDRWRRKKEVSNKTTALFLPPRHCLLN